MLVNNTFGSKKAMAASERLVKTTVVLASILGMTKSLPEIIKIGKKIFYILLLVLLQRILFDSWNQLKLVFGCRYTYYTIIMLLEEYSI